MTESELKLPLKTGLLIVAVAWFLFLFHELVKATYSINEYQFFTDPVRSWILATDAFGLLGIISRVAASLTAVVGIAFYFIKKGTMSPTAHKLLKGVLVAEAIYWIASFLPSAIWGLVPASVSFGGEAASFNWFFFINTTLPCLVESIAIPVALLKLVSELNPNKRGRNAAKWGLIVGTVYVFVFWLNNTSNWLNVALRQTSYYTGAENGLLYPTAGFEYVVKYPDHILSFGLTTIGLLIVTLYAAYFTKKSLVIDTWRSLNFRRIGLIVTVVGLYFLVNYVMWLSVGTSNQLVLVEGVPKVVDVKWTDWYAWLLGHNLDLWALSLPLVGLPLLFHRKRSEEAADPGAN